MDNVVRNAEPGRGGQPWGQPFTYDLFDALKLLEFGRRGPSFAESSEPRNTGHREAVESNARYLS